MNIYVRLFSMAVSVIVVAAVFRALVKQKLSISDSVLWFGIAIVTLLAGFFPQIITWMSNLVGIDYPPTLIFLLAIIVLLLIVFKTTSKLSIEETRVRELGIQLSIMQEDVKKLRSQLSDNQKTVPHDGADE